ncbi:MAG TPA: cytochrome c biogenesis protein CcdA [Polyangiaceae bacterium]
MGIASYLALYGAGLLTFASPCVLPLLPMYLAVLAGARASGDDEPRAKQQLRRAGVGFAIGLSCVFIVLGMGASAAAASLVHHRRGIELGAGLLMVLFGAKLLGLLRVPWLDREARPLLARVPNAGGFSGGILFGAAFAVGWTPCVGPVLGAALTYAATRSANPLVAGTMLAAYAAGLATPLLIASFAASRILVLTRQLRSYTPILQRGTGVALITVGALVATHHSPPNQSSSSAPVAACESSAKACATGAKAQAGRAAESASLEQLPRGPAMVEFVSGHCSVCKRMHPLVAELERICPAGLIARIDVDDVSGQSVAAYYGVTLVPTFVSIDAAGGEVQRAIGEQTRQQLLLALSEIRGVPCEAAM